MDKLSSIIIGFRLKTLPAVLGPLLLVISIGLNNSINIYKIALVIFIGIFLQILVNLLNDVQDFNKGLDAFEITQGPLVICSTPPAMNNFPSSDCMARWA